MSTLEKIDKQKTPCHIAIIMDGNGRWAKQKGENRLFGHNIGVESVREALKGAQETNVKYLTLYAFSTENWNRPKEEVEGLMNLLVTTLTKEIDELHKNNVIVSTIGDIQALPGDCGQELELACNRTKENTGVNLILALNYSAKWEIIEATKRIALKVKNDEINVNDIDSEMFPSFLTTSGIPDPELLIRTSGEHRLSNFLLWQLAYAEFYFEEVLWPEFTREHLYEAILNYQSRERRFGKVSEQLEDNI